MMDTESIVLLSERLLSSMQTQRANETGNRTHQTGKLHSVSYTNKYEECSKLNTIGSVVVNEVADCTDKEDLVILQKAWAIQLVCGAAT